MGRHGDREPEATTFDRWAATLTGVGDRATGWVAARVKDTLQEFVSRALYGETITPEPSDKWDAPERDGEHDRPEGVTVIVVEEPEKDQRRADRDDPGMDR